MKTVGVEASAGGIEALASLPLS